MASIVVSGDTSGAVTLSAPSVAGTTTVTLPSSTGTMALLQTPSFATTIGVGAATASASGAGISFPATQSASSDANTLDDYEEGTWTPSVTSQSGSISAYSATGSYTKIGRNVTLYGNIYVTNFGTASGQIFVSGVPFSILSSSQYGGVCRETTATGNVYYPFASSANVYIQNSTNGGVTWGTNYRYEFINVYQTT